jgi:UDP-glucose 4-epimerase
MNWLITGGCGFLGISLVTQLVAEGGHRIRVVDNLSVGTRDDLAAVSNVVEIQPTELATAIPPQDKKWGDSNAVQLIVGDILDDKLALAVARGADVIVHFAANTGVGPSVENPRMDCVTNMIGTFNYLEAARQNKVKRFVFASSGAPVGECEPPIHEEKVPHPVSPYGASKLAGEGYCSAYFRTYGIETVALRFGNVYGPGSGHKDSLVAKFIRRAFNGEILEIYGDGTQTRDFIYIDDLVRAARLAATVPGVGGEIFQIATNHETTVAEITEQLIPLLEGALNRHVRYEYLAPRLGDVMRNYSDTSKAERMLGWCAETKLQDGLMKTIRWYQDALQAM